jgi:hypothetical protein
MIEQDPFLTNSIFQRPEVETNAEELYHKGQAARALLFGTPIFKDALREAEYRLIGRVLEAADATETYAAKSAVVGLGAIEESLRAFIADGDHARIVLQESGALPKDD